MKSKEISTEEEKIMKDLMNTAVELINSIPNINNQNMSFADPEMLQLLHMLENTPLFTYTEETAENKDKKIIQQINEHLQTDTLIQRTEEDINKIIKSEKTNKGLFQKDILNLTNKITSLLYDEPEIHTFMCIITCMIDLLRILCKMHNIIEDKLEKSILCKVCKKPCHI
jgi:hypothetical protein